MDNKYSFKELLENEIVVDFEKDIKVIFSKIEIPMIQRDYAQGRGKMEGKEFKLNETGKQFIDRIFNTLSQNGAMEMDFVYGSIHTNDQTKEYTFIPLDGQQRLTTLFLLYWYISSREIDGHEYNNLMILLKKFTYLTRTSSRRFCELLCKTKLSFDNNPSKEIGNLFWFFKSYQRDPTIKAMLNMLDAIHERYSNISNSQFYNNLEKLQFYILPLNGFNLTEDLYIKMNARGKQLTDFENFKAELIKWMNDENNSDYKEFYTEVEYHDRKLPYFMVISQKADNEWTDYFWRITQKNDINLKDKDGKFTYPSGKSIDPLFIRFVYRYFLNQYILKSILKSETDIRSIEKAEDFKFFAAESKLQKFEAFNNLLNYKEIKNFEKVFDALARNWNEIKISISPSWYDDAEIFSFLDSSITQSQRVVLQGMSLYLERNEFETEKFKQWMRIVWNLTENTDIADFSTAIGVMRLLEELSINSQAIYEYLSSNPLLQSQSSKIAIDEEKWKCSFIYKNNQFDKNWEKAFINAESHKFFKGSVSFLMSENMSMQNFEHRTSMAEKVFDAKGINEEYQKNGHIFLRALISRYNKHGHIIWKNFTDIDEKEHYLKKMLASDEIIRNATRDWFLLNDVNDLNNTLDQEISKISQITGWDVNNLDTQRRTKKAHEDLFKKGDLQNWMQQQQAVRIGWRDSKLYISRPSAWYDWILLDGYRNEIIAKLISFPYFCLSRNQCTVNNIPIPYFFGNGNIKLTRNVTINNEEFEFEYLFDTQFLRIGIRETEDLVVKFSGIQLKEATENDYSEEVVGWICWKKYDYQADVKHESDIDLFIKKIEDEFFDQTKPNSIVSKINAFLTEIK